MPPDDLVAFSLQDPLFPHDSTGDQFLNAMQFRCLVQFGEAATTFALRDPGVIAAIQAGLASREEVRPPREEVTPNSLNDQQHRSTL